MKINLKFGQKQESVSTGLQVITNLRVGGTYGSAEEYLKAFLNANPGCNSYSSKCLEAQLKHFSSCNAACNQNEGPCNDICNLGNRKVAELWFPEMGNLG